MASVVDDGSSFGDRSMTRGRSVTPQKEGNVGRRHLCVWQQLQLGEFGEGVAVSDGGPVRGRRRNALTGQRRHGPSHCPATRAKPDRPDD
jgi:hypothetical protein